MADTKRVEHPEPRREALLPEPAPGVRRSLFQQAWILLAPDFLEDEGGPIVACPAMDAPAVRDLLVVRDNRVALSGPMPAAIDTIAAELTHRLRRWRPGVVFRPTLYVFGQDPERNPDQAYWWRGANLWIMRMIHEDHWVRRIRTALGIQE